MSQVPPAIPGPLTNVRPHRAVLVLVLGILGIVVCFICGIVAWILGNADIREMEAGRMDPSGLGMTKAGKICGMIGTILALLGVVWVLFWIFVIGGLAVAGAAGAAGAGAGH